MALYQCFIKPDGRRVTASRAFLQPVAGNPLCNRRTGALVDRLLLLPPQSSDGGRGERLAARGVVLATGEVFWARREVVLCAGVIATPCILMRSGIGPAAELQAHGITPLVGSDHVGAHLRDHSRVAVRWRSVIRPAVAPLFSHVEANLYAHSGINGHRGDGSPPDIQIQQDHVLTNDDLLEDPAVSRGFNLKPHCARPRSEGTVRLASADPAAKPLIDPGYLQADEDVRCLVAGVRAARGVVAQRAFDGIRDREVQPGTAVQTDEQLATWIRENVDTGYHPVGTCRFGAGGAEAAVLDPALRVYGIKGLRVLDASAFPTLPNGNTQAATFMLAEAGCESLLRDASLADMKAKL